MNTPEKDFWKTLQPMILGHAQRVENMTGSGMPDLNVCFKGQEFWIELKVCQPEILIRREQWAWHHRRMASGGKCFLLALEPETNTVFFSPTFNLNVMPYGRTGKYVQVVNRAELPNTPKASLRDFLKTNLFTS